MLVLVLVGQVLSKKTLKQAVSQIRSEDWFVWIDLKDAYFHVSILPTRKKFLRFAFGGKAYQYRVLPFGLALSPHTFTKCVDAASVAATGHPHTQLHQRLVDSCSIRADGCSASRCRSCPHESAGVKTEPQEMCAFSGSENHLSGRGVEFAPDAGLYDPCSDRVARVKEGRALTVKQFQRLLVLMAAASNRIPIGLLYKRPLQ